MTSVETLDPPTREEAILAAARSRLWRLLGEAFAYPDAPLLEVISGGALAASLREAIAAVHPAVAERADWDGLQQAGEGDDLAVEYTRLFDVGPSGPPCPLYGGLYGGTRMKTMEEAVRFYNHFGLKMAEAPRELPDHLVTQLEFLHYLAFREAEALERGADAGPFQRAQRDFVARHPGAWVPKLRRRVDERQPAAYFAALVALLEGALEAERDRLAAQA